MLHFAFNLPKGVNSIAFGCLNDLFAHYFFSGWMGIGTSCARVILLLLLLSFYPVLEILTRVDDITFFSDISNPSSTPLPSPSSYFQFILPPAPPTPSQPLPPTPPSSSSTLQTPPIPLSPSFYTPSSPPPTFILFPPCSSYLLLPLSSSPNPLAPISRIITFSFQIIEKWISKLSLLSSSSYRTNELSTQELLSSIIIIK